MKILSFGQIAEITKKTEWTVDNITSTAQLRQVLAEQFPELARITYQTAINQKVVKGDSPLQNSDTVALLPPFSGG